MAKYPARLHLPAGSEVQYEVVSREEWLAAIRQNSATVDMPRLFEGKQQNWVGPWLVTARHFILYCRSGEVRVKFGDCEVSVPQGSLFWAPPGMTRLVYGDYAITDRYHVEVTREGRQISWSDRPHVIRNASALVPLCQYLTDWFRSPGNHQDELIRGLMLSFSVAFFETLDWEQEHGPQRLGALDQRRLHQYVLDNLGDEVSPADLAREAGLTPDYFSRLFKKAFGTSPRAYIARERLHRAAELLVETDRPMKSICAELGIRDPSSFCRQFRSLFKTTPGRYRREQRGLEATTRRHSAHTRAH